MIPYLLFDFDGTLADSRRLGIKLYNELAEQYKFRQITDHDIPQLHSMSIRDRMRWMGVAMWVIPRLAIDVMREYRQSVGSLEPCGDILDALQKLQALGFRMSIISSNQSDNILMFLKQQGWTMFEQVIGANQLFGKHQAIKKFMKQHKLKPSEVLYIGDELRDWDSCTKSGCDMVAVTWGFDSEQLLKNGKPTYVVNSTEELLHVITHHGGVQ